MCQSGIGNSFSGHPASSYGSGTVFCETWNNRKYPCTQEKALWLLSFLSCHSCCPTPLRGSLVGNMKWEVIQRLHKLFVCRCASAEISHWAALSQFWNREDCFLRCRKSLTDSLMLQCSRHKPRSRCLWGNQHLEAGRYRNYSDTFSAKPALGRWSQ